MKEVLLVAAAVACGIGLYQWDQQRKRQGKRGLLPPKPPCACHQSPPATAPPAAEGPLPTAAEGEVVVEHFDTRVTSLFRPFALRRFGMKVGVLQPEATSLVSDKTGVEA